ncbi:MAG: hypothetical protein DBY43_07850 [Clostridiaceae bacterium]|nr:MAG: hypothetical protein DBY43_07850 [Clostridiaceae bacterium]
MDFNKFQEWCQNKGFVIKLPSGYVKLINLDVSSFESFKGIFNLCMLFFYEELYKQKEEEKEDGLRKFIEKYKNSPTILYPADDDGSNPYIYYKKNGESFVEKIRDAGVNKNKSSWNLEKYSDEDIEKLADYLLTPIPYENGMVPMDRLLNYLENKKKYEDSESESKYSKSNWCDLGKENYQKELKNCKSGD